MPAFQFRYFGHVILMLSGSRTQEFNRGASLIRTLLSRSSDLRFSLILRNYVNESYLPLSNISTKNSAAKQKILHVCTTASVLYWTQRRIKLNTKMEMANFGSMPSTNKNAGQRNVFILIYVLFFVFLNFENSHMIYDPSHAPTPWKLRSATQSTSTRVATCSDSIWKI